MSSLKKAVHLWVCDTDGGVHVLCHVTSTSTENMRWREVEETSQYLQVVGGSEDIVCSVNDQELYIRDNVSYSMPLGKTWLPTGCHMTQVAVGSKYLVVILPEGGVLIGNVNPVRSKNFCPIKWEEISSHTPKKLAHITMTLDDVLFGVTSGGDVYGCYGIQELSRPLNWDFLSKPPIPARRGFLSSLFQSTPTVLFDHVTSNSEGVWCYSKRNDQLWLLTVRELAMTDKVSRQTSWTRFNFESSAPKLTAITCHPENSFTLYGISEDGKTLFEMQASDSSVTISELPFHGCGDISMATISCCQVTSREEEEQTTPSLYPKLPKKEKGLCCENGTCSFCLKRSPLTFTGTTFTNDLYTIDNYRQQLKTFRREERNISSQSEGTKRFREDTDFSYLSPCQQVTTLNRRRRHPFTHKLIRDIPVIVSSHSSHKEVGNVTIIIITSNSNC